MSIKYPDYNKCITNLTCSILKEFQVEPKHQTLPMVDNLLEKNYKNVVVLLLDGMGINILKKNLKEDGFFRKHLVDVYSSVFPPTTVAATTSVDSGLYPNEHSWLGWDCYYKELDQNVTVFRNTLTDTDIPAADYHVAFKYYPYQNIVSQIQEAGCQAFYATPFVKPYPADFDDICNRIEELCQQDGKKYVYGYWHEPDHTMHRKGCYSADAKEVLQKLESKVEELCEKLEDTLVLITADHGHMDSAGETLEDYPQILECLVRMPSIEPRALNLFIKDDMKEQFETEFQKLFGDKFLLLTKKEVKEKQIFGTGTDHARFDEMLGDYLAVAVSDLSIYNTREQKETFIGVHAGLTKEEMEIPLIAIEKKL